MCMNCKNSNINTLKVPRMYFSPKKYMDYFECPTCFQIEKGRVHEHVKIEDNWEYDRGNKRDVIKCKVCRLVLEERPHELGFQDEGDALENYLTSADTSAEIQTEEVYTRKLAI